MNADFGARWTPEEDQYLIDHYNGENCRAMAEHLTGRTYNSVRHRVVRLQREQRICIKSGNYTPEEEQYVIENFTGKGSGTIETLAVKMGRSPGGLRLHLQKMRRKGIDIGRKDLWTEEELATLKRMYGHYPQDEIAKALGRTKRGIVGKIKKLWGAGDYSNQGLFSTKNVEDILGWGRGVTRGHIRAGALKALRQKPVGPYNKSEHWIKPIDLRLFMRTYPFLYEPNAVQRGEWQTYARTCCPDQWLTVVQCGFISGISEDSLRKAVYERRLIATKYQRTEACINYYVKRSDLRAYVITVEEKHRKLKPAFLKECHSGRTNPILSSAARQNTSHSVGTAS